MKRPASPSPSTSRAPKRAKKASGTVENEPSSSKTANLKPVTEDSLFHDVDPDFLRTSHLPWKIFSPGELPGAQVFYLPNFLEEDTANDLYTQLDALDTWYRPTLKVYGKSVVQSRAIAVYATAANATMRYSGQTVTMNYPYPPAIAAIQHKLERALGMDLSAEHDAEDSEAFHGFNHVMLNRYEDGSVYIGRHRDNKENKVIASLSIGAERTFIMTPAATKSGTSKTSAMSVKPVKWTLGNGSLLIMQGETQANWKHEIPKEPKVKDGRISLTFRQIL